MEHVPEEESAEGVEGASDPLVCALALNLELGATLVVRAEVFAVPGGWETLFSLVDHGSSGQRSSARVFTSEPLASHTFTGGPELRVSDLRAEIDIARARITLSHLEDVFARDLACSF